MRRARCRSGLRGVDERRRRIVRRETRAQRVLPGDDLPDRFVLRALEPRGCAAGVVARLHQHGRAQAAVVPRNRHADEHAAAVAAAVQVHGRRLLADGRDRVDCRAPGIVRRRRGHEYLRHELRFRRLDLRRARLRGRVRARHVGAARAIACASRRSVRAGISPIHACVRRIQPGIRHDSARRSSRMVFVGGRVRPTIGGAPHRTAGACAPPRCACRRASRGALAPPARAVSVLACDGRNRRASSDRPTGRGGVDCS